MTEDLLLGSGGDGDRFGFLSGIPILSGEHVFIAWLIC